MISKEVLVTITIFLVALMNQLTTLEASCYFPQEFQGEFQMQSSASIANGVEYNTLNITENSIPIWGNCHRRIGNNFILMFNYSETSCIRCLHLKLRSPNVLQVFASSQETISKCFTNEESAEANCPSEESLLAREAAEILLFKTSGSYTLKQYCPIDGKYYLNYKGPTTDQPNECVGFNSTLDLCPSGSTLNFRLRSCTFQTTDVKFDCLGHWKGPNGDTFLLFTDSRHVNMQKPKYRCALYKQDHVGKIEIALSSDSTCTSDLHNSTSGFETFVLVPKAEEPWPAEVSFGTCNFPKWLHGDWEHMRVDGDTIIYKDHSSFKTYTIKCVGDMEDSDKFVIFSRSQCNEESYNCMRIANRSRNIIEFQLGTNTSDIKDVFSQCADSNFKKDSWITQGRIEISPGTSPGMCPITGEYTGQIPDATILCAKLWSDCRAPELMYYQVSHCESQEVYEEREYQCLGHWREANLLYTYTQRRDVAAGTYECFVGSIFTDEEIYIKEAGEHCQRNVDPLRHGMKLIKKQPLYSCIERSTTPKHITRISTERSIPKYTSTFTPRRTTSGQNMDTDSKPGDKSTGLSAISYPVITVYILSYLFIRYL
ncbi:uncharacterized protein LOC108908962 isoform X2 [Anoplophora glabripennis]|uniref:uncharacterized protein LOC108908962 isoform X2 n=1 Tax=Anoplophora glabripennis TaxID=217634 RepID=UPI000873F9EE|nr:uncharacterized protein LOC108908962 isoform X2 [Anoplophora glabripennis]